MDQGHSPGFDLGTIVNVDGSLRCRPGLLEGVAPFCHAGGNAMGSVLVGFSETPRRRGSRGSLAIRAHNPSPTLVTPLSGDGGDVVRGNFREGVEASLPTVCVTDILDSRGLERGVGSLITGVHSRMRP